MSASTSNEMTVLTDVMVTMRDGVRLATDVYLPKRGRAAGPLPVILERTPYDKCGVSRSEVTPERSQPLTRPEVAAYFVRHGFAVAMQDCRGRFRSEGHFSKYVNEAQDGYDTLRWMIEQTWCDGRIATMGFSYGAHTQLALACLAPPGLACMFLDSGGFASAYHGGIRRGGAFELKQATWAYRQALQSEQESERRAALMATDLLAWFRRMPWTPGHSPLSATPEYEAYLFEQWRQGVFTDFWRQPGLYAAGFYDDIPDIPIAILGSWYDPHVISCVNNFCALSQRKRSATRLIVGPWTHGDRSCSFAGDVDFGDTAILDGNIAEDYLALRLAWFERWLGNADSVSGATELDVRYFQMGGGDGDRDERGRLRHGGGWRSATTWPPQPSQTRILHLGPGGRLSALPFSGPPGDVEFRSDPADPVPTIGGAVTSGEPVMQGGAFDQRVHAGVFTYHREHAHAPLAARADVTVWETDPLEADLIVTGEVEAELWVSSDCVDTDFTVKLIDAYPPSEAWPEGFAMNVADGILRARYRDGWDREAAMHPGEVYRIVIQLLPTSNLFRAGHRVRIDIASSNYPHFDINPNTGGAPGDGVPPRIAANHIHFGARWPSRIKLPV